MAARINRVLALTTALLAYAAIPATAQAPPEPALSATQTTVVNRKIAALHSEADRRVASEWSNSKKVAEILCRPAATAYWKKKAPGADRVFLGTSAPETLILESNQRLTGSGQYRTPKGWTDFRFTCDLDPEKGTVTAFAATPPQSGGQ
ncbi:MAG TPA: hypothetical protein VK638_36975 [Edaphobacter sp.]|nr:hypothetical protein [Edaphobacter sp.]